MELELLPPELGSWVELPDLPCPPSLSWDLLQTVLSQRMLQVLGSIPDQLLHLVQYQFQQLQLHILVPVQTVTDPCLWQWLLLSWGSLDQLLEMDQSWEQRWTRELRL